MRMWGDGVEGEVNYLGEELQAEGHQGHLGSSLSSPLHSLIHWRVLMFNQDAPKSTCTVQGTVPLVQ